jgi:hypothetical protein
LRFHGKVLAEQDQEQEPIIEMGKDNQYKHWGRILIAVILAGIVIGYVASVSYVQYPYSVNVSGTFTSANGAVADEVAIPGCNAWLYTQCPDPGLQPVYQCFAEPVMNMTQYCTSYDLENTPGHYSVSVRNGEDYALTAYLVYKNDSFAKVCMETIKLTPDVTHHNVTQNFSC